MSDAHTDKSRAEFEKWAWQQKWIKDCQRDPEREYGHYETQKAWAAWQASRATTEESSGVELPEPDFWLDGGSTGCFYESTVRALLAGVKESLTVAGLPDGYKSGIQTDERVTLIFEDKTTASAWFDGFMNRCDGTAPAVPQGWMPIESAPKDKTLLLGYRNAHGHWRTLRGEWFSREEIDELWEEPDGVEPGWFETSVEADDVPNVWCTDPTHWMPLPQPPKEQI